MNAAFIAIAVALVTWALWLRRRNSSNLPYPPGPPGHFLFGNHEDIYSKVQRLRWSELADEYGDIYHLQAWGDHIIVISSEEVVNDLFEKRSANFSDRVHIQMVEMMGWDINMALMPYAERWKIQRRIFQQGFNQDTIVQYRPAQRQSIAKFLQRLLDTPSNLPTHTEELIGYVCMKAVFGHEIQDIKKDKMFMTAVNAIDNLSNSLLPGEWLVNSLPFLRFLPEWVPGTRFKSFARETREVVRKMLDEPYEEALTKIGSETTLVSILEEANANVADDKKIDIKHLKEACGTAVATAGETIMVVMRHFFLLMRQHPEIQDRAYAEIGEIVGRNRIPDFGDRSSLPYVEAVYREVMRFQPVHSFALPHTSKQDDVYKGYFIPKGSKILASTWAMNNNPKKYPQPRRFWPERYLSEDLKTFVGDDISSILAFGHGRRICVGRYMADETSWHVMACVLATFRIEKPDIPNDPVDSLEDFDDAFIYAGVAHAIPYECRVSPRTPDVAELVRDLKEEYANV